MPQKAHKLSKFSRAQVNHLFKTACAVLRHPLLTILRCPASGDTGRILVVTSRKVGNAPTRNQIRRRLKAIFYEEKIFERGFDFAIIVRKEATSLNFTQLKDLVLKAFQTPCPPSS